MSALVFLCYYYRLPILSLLLFLRTDFNKILHANGRELELHLILLSETYLSLFLAFVTSYKHGVGVGVGVGVSVRVSTS